MYAINSTQNGWRSINSVEDLLEGETFSVGQPALTTVDLDYKQLRAAEYPPFTDYLDGLVKGDAEQTQAYCDACLAVKLKYPKP